MRHWRKVGGQCGEDLGILLAQGRHMTWMEPASRRRSPSRNVKERGLQRHMCRLQGHRSCWRWYCRDIENIPGKDGEGLEKRSGLA